MIDIRNGLVRTTCHFGLLQSCLYPRRNLHPMHHTTTAFPRSCLDHLITPCHTPLNMALHSNSTCGTPIDHLLRSCPPQLLFRVPKLFFPLPYLVTIGMQP